MNSAQRTVVVIGVTTATAPLWVLLGATAAAALLVTGLWTGATFVVFRGYEHRDPWATP
jgi:membrane glycosyltransferase